MAFDPIQEDCLRLVLRAMQRDRVYPLENQAYIEAAMERFTVDPNQLIRTDRDRSFHLTARATEIVDYRAPFMSSDNAAESALDQAEDLLSEARELDPANRDAERMLAALRSETDDEYVRFLIDGQDEVLAECRGLANAAADPYDREFAADLGLRPALRWLNALAARTLISGRYRMALDAVERSLELAPDDPGDCRFTGMLALAKLECGQDALERFYDDHAQAFLAHPGIDPWTLLARIATAYKEFAFDEATRLLQHLIDRYPRAERALYYQAEFPDGVYARVHVEPGSEDELILAVSEATVLLQEGLGAPENAPLAVWLATHPLVQQGMGAFADAVRADEARTGLEGDN